MKKVNYILPGLLALVAFLVSTSSDGAEQKRKWMTSACYKFRLSAWDKFNGDPWKTKFVITSTRGETFIAERNNDSDSGGEEVFFPDDFHDANAPGINGSVDCFDGETYKWQIYVNGNLMDSGTIGFTRDYPPK